MSKLSDRTFIIILIIIGAIYFIYKSNTNNDNVDISKISFIANGEEKQISDYKGQNLVVNFYASWCGPCMNELPEMTQTASEWKGNITFLWLTDDSMDYINKNKSTFNQSNFFKLTGRLKDAEVKTIPFTIFINKKGEVISTASGELAWGDESFKKETLGSFN